MRSDRRRSRPARQLQLSGALEDGRYSVPARFRHEQETLRLDAREPMPVGDLALALSAGIVGPAGSRRSLGTARGSCRGGAWPRRRTDGADLRRSRRTRKYSPGPEDPQAAGVGQTQTRRTTKPSGFILDCGAWDEARVVGTSPTYDTFLATWHTPLWERSAITFPSDAEGQVRKLDVRGLRTYRRVGDSHR